MDQEQIDQPIEEAPVVTVEKHSDTEIKIISTVQNVTTEDVRPKTDLIERNKYLEQCILDTQAILAERIKTFQDEIDTNTGYLSRADELGVKSNEEVANDAAPEEVTPVEEAPTEDLSPKEEVVTGDSV